MNIIFDHRPGEIFDFFKTIWTMNNYDYVLNLKEEYNIGEFNDFEKLIIDKLNDPKIDKRVIEKYFYNLMRPEYFLDPLDLWNVENIEEFIKKIKALDDYQALIRIDKTIQLICNKAYEEINPKDHKDYFEEIDNIKKNIMVLIEDKDLPAGLKWEIYSSIKKPKEYINLALEEIEPYLLIYNTIKSTREEVINKYKEELINNIKNDGINYLLQEIDYTYDFNSEKDIKITISALVSLRIYEEENDYYVFIGPSIRKALHGRRREDNIEKNLSFIRGIAENTRYKIINLLKTGEYYGQEIADKLNITKTNAFYHLDFLVSLKLVSLVKDSQKNYYSLNKDILYENIDRFVDYMK